MAGSMRKVSMRLLTSALVAANSSATALAERGAWPALGGIPDPDEMARSPRYRDGAFHNVKHVSWLPQPGSARATAREMVAGNGSRRPQGEIPLARVRRDHVGADALAVTWFGHASSLVEIDGSRVLIDPVWGDRVSPVAGIGPRRLHEPPHSLNDLGKLDAIVISHDHYDHLDMPTVRALAAAQDAPFVVPLGVGAHLRRWAVPDERIIELDWFADVELAGLRITATPGQHFSGRSLTRNPTLWASWVIAGPKRRIYYTGDTGYFPGFAEIGTRYGPFDAALIQIGAYNVSWPDVHMTPEEGVSAHREAGGGLLIPVHWGTFNLAPHPWSEPVERLMTAAAEHGVEVAVPKPGERVDAADERQADPWWRAIA